MKTLENKKKVFVPCQVEICLISSDVVRTSGDIAQKGESGEFLSSWDLFSPY
jgi:hypothetical protein